MITQANSNLFNKVCASLASRPLPGLALTTSNSTLSVTVDPTSIVLTQSGEADQTIVYLGYSLQDVATAINATPLDVHAYPLIDGGILGEGAFFTIGSTKSLLSDFILEDRVENGAVLRLKSWAIKPRKTTHFSLQLPYDDGPLFPWYPRISIGSLAVKRGGQVYEFSIPEYSKQPWSLQYGPPYVEMRGAIPIAFRDNILKVARAPIYWNGSNIQIYSDNRPLGNVLEDVDVHNGLLYLKPGIDITDATIDYTYIEETYVYQGINLNPHLEQQPDILDKVVLIYLTPKGYTMEPGTIHHRIATSVQGAIDSIPLQDERMPVLVLGAILIKQVDFLSRTQVSDARVLGGGLFGPRRGAEKETWRALIDKTVAARAKSLEETYKDTPFLADIGHYDGFPAPSAGCVLIRFPDDMEDKQAEIQQAIYDNIAMGIYPVIDFYPPSGGFTIDGGGA